MSFHQLHLQQLGLIITGTLVRDGGNHPQRASFSDRFLDVFGLMKVMKAKNPARFLSHSANKQPIIQQNKWPSSNPFQKLDMFRRKLAWLAVARSSKAPDRSSLAQRGNCTVHSTDLAWISRWMNGKRPHGRPLISEFYEEFTFQHTVDGCEILHQLIDV